MKNETLRGQPQSETREKPDLPQTWRGRSEAGPGRKRNIGVKVPGTGRADYQIQGVGGGQPVGPFVKQVHHADPSSGSDQPRHDN